MDKKQGVKVFLVHIPMEIFLQVVSEASREEKSYSWVINDALAERFRGKKINDKRIRKNAKAIATAH